MIKTATVIGVWALLATAVQAQTIWSETSFPFYESSDYSNIDQNRKDMTGVYEDELLVVETLKVYLNNDDISDTIYLATFGHGDELYQQLEIWVTIGGDEYQIYQNMDYGTPYRKMVSLDEKPYIVDAQNNATWINWLDLAEPWVDRGFTEYDPSWQELVNGG